MATLPGSDGEHHLQATFGTADRARTFYDRQVLPHLNPRMREFITAMEMMFVSTADAAGNCDCSIRCGTPGFVVVLDDAHLLYPEYRGNGVMASLGNVTENPHVGLLFVDFFHDCVGLHVNGDATIVETAALLQRPGLPERVHADAALRGGRRPERWVQVHVEEAYIHCAKHLPLLGKREKKIHWGTDDPVAKGGDYFHVASTSEAGDEK